MKKIISITVVLTMLTAMFTSFTAIAAQNPAEVLFRDCIINDLSNQIDIRYKIIANDDIDLSKLTIRYYYTNSGTQPQNYFIDWSTVDRANITGTFSKIEPAVDKADSCFDINFSKGTMDADGTAEVLLRLAKSDWSNYDQTQNYSYKAEDNGEYTLWSKIAVYYDGTLIQGTEPSDVGEIITPDPTAAPISTPESTPTPEATEMPDPTPASTLQPTPSVNTPVWVQTLGDHEHVPNTMYVWYKIISRSSEPIELSRIKIRYYYTNDNNREQIMECDNFQDETGTNRERKAVTATFYPLSETSSNMNYFCETGFDETAGKLNPDGFIRIDTRIHSTDWSNYDFSNDYSYNASDEFIYWDKVEVYIDGELVWGENVDIPAEDEEYIPVRTMGFEYEQRYDISGDIVKPEITGASVKVLDKESGKYQITIKDSQFVCDENANPFFFWSAREGVFSEPSDNFNSVIFQADKGTGHRQVKVIIGIGDGLGYVDKKAILLDGNKTDGGDNK